MRSPRRSSLALTLVCWALLVWLFIERTPSGRLALDVAGPELSLTRLPVRNATLGVPVTPLSWLSAACADAWVARGEICEVPLTAHDAPFDVVVRSAVISSAPAWTRRPTLRYLFRSLYRLRRAGHVGRVTLLTGPAALNGTIALPDWLDADRAELGGLDIVAREPGDDALLEVLRTSAGIACLVMDGDTILSAGLEPSDVATLAFGPVLRLDYAAEPASRYDSGASSL